MTSRTQEIPQYYFAFGSNMHLTQMASRCPDSRVFAKGILHGYRWQINQRGVANVVRCKRSEEPEPVVEGILFTVSSSDIRSLDRSEGISKQFYDKALRWVDVGLLAIPALEGERTALAAERLKGLQVSERVNGTQGLGQTHEEGVRVEKVEALVYLSGRYKKDGQIRSEYVQRMELAMSDALKLGVSKQYLRDSLYPLVFGEESTMTKGKTTSSTKTGQKSRSQQQRKSRHHRRHSLSGRDRPKAPKGQHYQGPGTQIPRPQNRPDEITMNMVSPGITESGVAGIVGRVVDIGLGWLFGSGNEREPGRT